jgi:DNA-binding IclR family transcriptional regulator
VDVQDPRTSTTQRVAHVLLALGGDEPWLGVTELARRLDLSKAVVHRILQSLLDTGLVRYDESGRRYALGPAAVSLGRTAGRRTEIAEAAAPLLAHLSQLTGETTTLAARVGHGRVYVDQVESSQHIRIAIRIGEHQALTNGASGLSILAFLPEADVDLALSVPVPQFTVRTVVDPAAIRERLAEIRERGWASTSSERVPHSSSIAAPVLDAAGDPVGSLSVAYLDARFPDEDVPEVARLVTDAAQRASERLAQIQGAGPRVADAR